MHAIRLSVLCLFGIPILLQAPAAQGENLKVAEKFTEMAEPVTSFGAATIGDQLYVYGGHTGEAHNYNSADQSNQFRRLKLTQGAQWEKLPSGPKLQGLAMVSHGGKLYRIGGFTAHNAKGEANDLRSVADVVCFDPETKEWQPVASLPEPRSSHDAVVIGNKIYVAGGWQLRGGDDKPVWRQSAYVMDLSASAPQWEALPQPPFKRRALSLGQLGNKLAVVCGMTDKRGISMEVDLFDPATNRWSKAPNLPGEDMDGFGTSAFALGDKLYVSNVTAKVYCLAQGSKQWVEAGELEEQRFFHRMIATANRQLLVVGGAEWLEGKSSSVYTIPVKSTPNPQN